MKSPISILITGAGAPGIRGTLYALRHNPDQMPIRTVGIDLNPDAIGRLWVDSFHRAPAPEDIDYPEMLLNICRAESVDLIIPQTTREIAILSRHINKFARAGIVIAVSPAEAIATANDKWKLLELFRDHRLPHPEFYITRSEAELIAAADRLGYPDRPVVVKPPVSNGMRGVRILRENAWDVERFMREKPSGLEISLPELLNILRTGESWPQLLVTEFLPGDEYSVDAFIGKHVSIALPRLRKAIRSGISFENVMEYREDLAQYTLTAGRLLGLQYAFGFQFKLDANGVPKVLESNPRVQGTMVAGVFSGVNVIWMMLLEAMGAPPISLPTELHSATFSRFWGGVGISEEFIDEI